MEEALAERDRILMGATETPPAFAPTEAQRQAMAEALAQRDRILMGY
jgi:hypothetical protein